MTCRTLLFASTLFAAIATPTAAQSQQLTAPTDSIVPHQRLRQTLFAIGSNHIFDSYLSPLDYSGLTLGFSYSGQRNLRWMGGRWTRQQLIDIAVTQASNPAGNANFYDVESRIGYGWHRKLHGDILARQVGWHFALGGITALHTGGTYSTRNGNNPAQARIAIDLSASAIAERRFALGKHTAIWSTQLELPLVGAMFAPDYGQSYYEIFSLAHYDRNVRLTTPISAPSARLLTTLTLPLGGRSSITLGYKADICQSAVNNLRRHAWNHSMVIGFVQRLQILPR